MPRTSKPRQGGAATTGVNAQGAQVSNGGQANKAYAPALTEIPIPAAPAPLLNLSGARVSVLEVGRAHT